MVKTSLKSLLRVVEYLLSRVIKVIPSEGVPNISLQILLINTSSSRHFLAKSECTKDSVSHTLIESVVLLLQPYLKLYIIVLNRVCGATILYDRYHLHHQCTMGQAVEIDILEVHKSKQILHAHL